MKLREVVWFVGASLSLAAALVGAASGGGWFWLSPAIVAGVAAWFSLAVVLPDIRARS